MRLLFPTFLVLFVFLSIPVCAQEESSGQEELKKGLSCYSELDLKNALMHLRKALAGLSPDSDPEYMQHMRTARWIIMLIYLASDDLLNAEKELSTLLTLDPGFELPPGDLPPKVRYIFRQAKEKMKKKNESSSIASKNPAGGTNTDDKQLSSKDQLSKQAPGSAPFYRLGALGSVLILFGDDSRAAHSGPGITIVFGLKLAQGIFTTIEFDYSYHPTEQGGMALQTAAMGLGADFSILSGPLNLTIGANIGALGMGTADRYDHWGLNLAGCFSLAWPPEGTWALVIKTRPSLVITSSDASFYLSVATGAEVRW